MQAEDATLSLTKEPSGEIRLRVQVPDMHGNRQKRRFAVAADGAGCAALVYSPKVRELPKTPAGKGAVPRRTEFGIAAKRAVKNSVGALKTLYGKRIVFATVTLPGSTKDAREALSAWSAKAIELLTHWIRYTAPGADYAYVWERQKSGALHIHAAIGHHDVLRLRALERSFQEYVHRMFVTLSRLAGTDMFARAGGGSWKGCIEVLRSNCVPVKKCVKRYMAKYLTKQAAGEQGSCPSRWWGCCRKLRAQVQALRRCIRQKSADWAKAMRSFETARRLTERRGYTKYGFSCPFSPSTRTLLIYPQDSDVDSFYALLTSVLQSSNYKSTERDYQNRRVVPIEQLLASR